MYLVYGNWINLFYVEEKNLEGIANSVGRTKEPTVEFHSPKDLEFDYINCWGEDHKAAKILILGTDPTAPVQGGLSVKNIHYPFGLESFEDGKSFSRHPYFRSIYYNLAELLDNDVDIDQFIREKVIVMNAVDQLLYDNEQKRYITTGECFQRKGKMQESARPHQITA